ncbi:MAG TPA: FAD-dependent oxidoreductase [Abditibacteriaceae bacterium]
MPKPIILAVDDEPQVLSAISSDLRRKYGEKYRIVRAESGEHAMEALEEIQRRGEVVSLILSDQRMPGMGGVELLEKSKALFPKARRALLTAYADTEAAIRAINLARLDYYLLKPWDPPEVKLYAVLDDLLEEWTSGYRPPFEGVRVVGHRWSPDSHAIKDFLGRNQVPFQWLDLSADPEASQLATSNPNARLPIIFLPDGTTLENPTSIELAERVGFNVRAESPFYDLIIIGGGPAGLAAAVYGSSEGLKTVMIERQAPGGQAGSSSLIENYLGFPGGVSGEELSRRAVTQARKFGVEILAPQEVCGVIANGPFRNVQLADGTEISGHSVLIATGVRWRTLDAPGLKPLQGRGVYYGATMQEASLFKDETVYIVGGANSAGQAAMHFASFASKVVMVIRAAELGAGMSDYLMERIQTAPNIEVLPFTRIAEAHGEDNLKQLTLENVRTGEKTVVDAAGLFIFIGAEPFTDFVENTVRRDAKGFLLTGVDLMESGKPPIDWPLERDPMALETNVPGIFVAGDVRHGSMKRVASGVGEGSTAISLVHQYLRNVR